MFNYKYKLNIKMGDELTKQEIEELKKLKRETESPKEEEKIIPLLKNTYKIKNKKVKKTSKIKDKKISQYKINIPKKFADFVGLNKEDFKVKSILDKKENKIIFEVLKND